jgi:hypothetical protein
MTVMSVRKDGFQYSEGVVTVVATGSIIQNVLEKGTDK